MGLVQTGSKTIGAQASAPADADAQDEQLWERAIANSMDAIRSLADKAQAERKAGRTKKVRL